jgi:2-amino-4-hydroxy-6-hydroxymethyldihydropteridine diphosphokinase
MKNMYVLLGSNTEAVTNLRNAVKLLRKKVKVVKISKVYESISSIPEDPKMYLNGVVQIATDEFDAKQLKYEILRKVEAELGRTRDTSSDVVTIDLDLLLSDEDIISEDGLTVPDPDILTKEYVAVPLADINPSQIHPTTKQTFKELAANLASQHGLTERNDIYL